MARMSAAASSRTLRLSLLFAFLALGPRLPAETFTWSADTVTMKLAEGQQHALLTGRARVQTQDIRITADQIELFGKDFIYAQCHGNVHVVDTKRGIDLTSQDLFYDRDKKISRVRGNAVMADLKNEMTVKGGFIEDRDTQQITIIQIGVRIFKKDIVCRSEFARYLRDKKVLELSGMPWVSKGSDIYQASRITINLDTEEINLEGEVTGSIVDKSAEKKPETATPGTPAAGTPTQPTGGTPLQPPQAPAPQGGSGGK
jgi:lipopolysaccharide export system protein LptA